MSARAFTCDVLVLGAGAREHALAWKLKQAPGLGRLIVAPGNAGMIAALNCEAWEFDQKPTSFGALVARARAEGIGLVVVGPDQLLADGISDAFQAAGIPCFGPTQAAAQIESSKAFCKDVMTAAGVPTARYFVATTLHEAEAILAREAWGSGWVIKADGLALGKGVVVARDVTEAREAAERLLKVSGKIVIEERLVGEELSWMALSDGERVALLEPARDYKRIFEGDRGPNTGGMGAISPVPGVGSARESAGLFSRVENEVFLPVLAEMKRRGCEFRGLLYAGLMWNPVGGRLSVLEFNARFGDPETQALLPRIQADLLELMRNAAAGQLTTSRVDFGPEKSCYVVAAAEGYPETPRTGDALPGLERECKSGRVFCAGVKASGGGFVTSGGRVFGALGMGLASESARAEALSRVEELRFRGMQIRRDIGATPVPVAVLASGQGSNFDALVEATRRGNCPIEVRVLVTDKPQAPVLARAARLGIPAVTVPFRAGETREAHEGRILECLAERGVRWAVLAGYMRVLTPKFLNAFRDERGYARVVNIHPSLLPKYPGMDSYRDAFEAKEARTGVTVHLVNEGVDAGPILAQEEVFIGDCRDIEEVRARGFAVEHRLYAQTLAWAVREEFRIQNTEGGLRAVPV